MLPGGLIVAYLMGMLCLSSSSLYYKGFYLIFRSDCEENDGIEEDKGSFADRSKSMKEICYVISSLHAMVIDC